MDTEAIRKIKEIREALRLSTTEMGERLNFSPSYVNLIENGNREPSKRVVANLFTNLGVSRTWWETGEGEMFADRAGGLQKSLSSDDVELLNLWRDIDDDDREATLALLRVLAERHRK